MGGPWKFSQKRRKNRRNRKKKQSSPPPREPVRRNRRKTERVPPNARQNSYLHQLSQASLGIIASFLEPDDVSNIATVSSRHVKNALKRAKLTVTIHCREYGAFPGMIKSGDVWQKVSYSWNLVETTIRREFALDECRWKASVRNGLGNPVATYMNPKNTGEEPAWKTSEKVKEEQKVNFE